jgi:hypothetical protein
MMSAEFTVKDKEGSTLSADVDSNGNAIVTIRESDGEGGVYRRAQITITTNELVLLLAGLRSQL